METKNFSQRIVRISAVMIGVAALAGCLAKEVKVDPTRTSAMVTFAVAPQGVDGMTTTKANICTFRHQVTAEKAVEFETNPPKMVEDNICLEFDKQGVRALAQLAVQGNQQVAADLLKTGFATVLTGGVNFAVQNEVLKAQGAVCAKGGCITTVNQNINNNTAHGGAGGQGGVGLGGKAAAVSQSQAVSASEANMQGTTGAPCNSGCQ